MSEWIAYIPYISDVHKEPPPFYLKAYHLRQIKQAQCSCYDIHQMLKSQQWLFTKHKQKPMTGDHIGNTTPCACAHMHKCMCLCVYSYIHTFPPHNNARILISPTSAQVTTGGQITSDGQYYTQQFIPNQKQMDLKTRFVSGTKTGKGKENTWDCVQPVTGWWECKNLTCEAFWKTKVNNK